MGAGQELGRGKTYRPIGPYRQREVCQLQFSVPRKDVLELNATRYPTFTLALQDMQDPLNLVHLFSKLPNSPKPGWNLKPEIISECSRLLSEWKVSCKTQRLVLARG